MFLVAGGIGAGFLGWRRSRNRRVDDQVTFDWDVPSPPEQAPAGDDVSGSDPTAAPEPPGGGFAVDAVPTAETAADSERRKREDESRRAGDTKFGEAVEHEGQERSELAEPLREDPLTEKLEGGAS